MEVAQVVEAVAAHPLFEPLRPEPGVRAHLHSCRCLRKMWRSTEGR